MRKVLIGALATIAAGGLGAAATWWMEKQKTPQAILEGQISTATETLASLQMNEPLNKNRIPRAELVEEIQRFVGPGAEENSNYLVLAGERGTGKSTLVAEALNGRQAVLRVKVDFLPKDSGMLTEACLGALGVPGCRNHAVLLEVCRRVEEKLKQLPVIVLEVEAGMVSTVEEMRVLCKWIKVWGVDTRLFRGIMVLSDANAVLTLHDDMRHRLLWPGDFSEAQARQFLDASSLLMGPEHADLRGRVLSVVGRRPMALVDLRDQLGRVKNEEDLQARVEQHLEDVLQEGRNVLKGFLAAVDTGAGGTQFTGSQARELMHQLLVSPNGTVRYNDVPVLAKSVAAVLKIAGAHALVCDSRRSVYRFHSPAVANAAAEEARKAAKEEEEARKAAKEEEEARKAAAAAEEEARKAALAAEEEAARRRRWW
jgi:hypothetical protein